MPGRSGRPGLVASVAERPRGTREEGGRRRPPGISAGKAGRLRDENRFERDRPGGSSAPGSTRGAASNRYDAARAGKFPAESENSCFGLFSWPLPGARRRAGRTARYRRNRRKIGSAAPSPVMSGDYTRALARAPMIYPELFKQLEAVRWNMDQDIPWDRFDAQPADRGAGPDDQDERHHRVGGAAGHRDVPARQPRRQRLLGVHERSGSSRSRSTRWC